MPRCSARARAQTDVVVMDISMPGMNGLVATRQLKQPDRMRQSSR